jgi:hypothetical protein
MEHNWQLSRLDMHYYELGVKLPGGSSGRWINANENLRMVDQDVLIRYEKDGVSSFSGIFMILCELAIQETGRHPTGHSHLILQSNRYDAVGKERRDYGHVTPYGMTCSRARHPARKRISEPTVRANW